MSKVELRWKTFQRLRNRRNWGQKSSDRKVSDIQIFRLLISIIPCKRPLPTWLTHTHTHIVCVSILIPPQLYCVWIFGRRIAFYDHLRSSSGMFSRPIDQRQSESRGQWQCANRVTGDFIDPVSLILLMMVIATQKRYIVNRVIYDESATFDKEWRRTIPC